MSSRGLTKAFTPGLTGLRMVQARGHSLPLSVVMGLLSFLLSPGQAIPTFYTATYNIYCEEKVSTV